MTVIPETGATVDDIAASMPQHLQNNPGGVDYIPRWLAQLEGMDFLTQHRDGRYQLTRYAKEASYESIPSQIRIIDLEAKPGIIISNQ